MILVTLRSDFDVQQTHLTLANLDVYEWGPKIIMDIKMSCLQGPPTALN